jgi:hypothetical protein
VNAALRTVTMVSGRVELVAPGSLPNDGKAIAEDVLVTTTIALVRNTPRRETIGSLQI